MDENPYKAPLEPGNRVPRTREPARRIEGKITRDRDKEVMVASLALLLVVAGIAVLAALWMQLHPA
jgi:hypothetical protein